MDQSSSQSMAGIVDKFGVYIQHIENVIRKQMVEAEVLMKYSVFIDILDSAKNFNLALQYKDIDIILLVEQIDGMKLSYQLFANKFQASPESTFELPQVKKLLTQIMHNENDEYFYQGIKLKNFQRGKDSIKNNEVLYVSSIIFCLEEWFGELTGDGENVEIGTRVVDGDKILHNICTVLDIHNWVLPDGILVNSDNVAVFWRAQLESIEILFSRFEEVFLKINSNISLDIIRNAYISIIICSCNHLNPLVSDPRQFWKHFYDRRNTQTWNQAFLLLELSLCAS